MNVNLVLEKAGGDRRSFPLPESVTVIGRKQDCDLCVPLMNVSRKHCQFNTDGGELTIRDLGSRNGTFVNDERIEEAKLGAGDRVKIGAVTFTVQIDGQPRPDTPPKVDSADIKPEEKPLDDLGDLGDLSELDDLDSLDDLIDLDNLDSQIDTAMDAFGDDEISIDQ